MTGDKPLGYWLRHIDQGLEANFAALMSARGLVRRSWQILNTLSRGPLDLPGLDAALAHFLDDSEPTVAPHVSALIDRGWLSADAQGAHRLTPLGDREYRTLAAHIEEEREAVIDGIGPEGYRTLIDLLHRVSANVDAIGRTRTAAV